MSFSNILAEAAIMRAILKRPDGFSQARELMPEDFTDTEYKAGFTSAGKLYSAHKPIDLPHLVEILGEQSAIELMQRVIRETDFGAEHNVSENVRILQSMSVRRRIESLCRSALDALNDPARGTDEIRDRLRRDLRGMDVVRTPEEDLPSMLVDALDYLTALRAGDVRIIKSGLASLDKAIGGFTQGEMTILGARTSVGKSAMALFLATEAAKQGFNVLYFSTEMGSRQLAFRLFQRHANLSNTAVLRTGDMSDSDIDELANALDDMQHLPIRFNTSARYIDEIHSAISDAADGSGVDFVVLDYLQQVKTRTRYKSDFERLNEVSGSVKEWTLEFNLPIIALAQVGRSAHGNMPTLAELRGSGDLEQDADNVLFLHRVEDVNDPALVTSGGIDDRGLLQTLQGIGEQYVAIGIAKQRQGNVGTVRCIFNPARMQYFDIFRGGRG